ncbi:SAUR-like auxin-responsive protein family [Prunus dulcis]|uniref:SAUR-like auxin-responsive protein family n=1 Tax=Prunus dulcis TaxID=3755 RepID=A0A4Y1RWY5_PRUDU|nr:SAUR-like auxin-responsive protein family [Prunus dulcis]
MWDFVQVFVVATRVLEIRFGSWEFRQVSGTSEVCLPSAGEKGGCLGASRFDAGCLAPRKCVFLRQGRRRGCLGASRFDAGSARFILM